MCLQPANPHMVVDCEQNANALGPEYYRSYSMQSSRACRAGRQGFCQHPFPVAPGMDGRLPRKELPPNTI
ncbi:uncharacterized protein PG998_013563 [Apiospora kogelbergensis]|uniref:Uncharacterized protein n=1 Tax=Apiospora kogelbergensis TaxID=1337665 RepID=A0AAW0R0Y5_9PEZI